MQTYDSDSSNNTDLSMDMEWKLDSSCSTASGLTENSDGEQSAHSSDSNRSANSSDEFEEFILKLSDWCIRSKTARDFMDELLKLLREIRVPVPKCTKTLLETPTRSVIPLNMGPGEFVYFGIENMLTKIDSQLLRDVDEIILKVCSDGVPKFKDSPSQLMPINGEIVNLQQIPLFTIMMYVGETKPCVDLYFRDFAAEAIQLMKDGVLVSTSRIRKPFSVLLFCGDAPQRAYMTATKGHTAKHGCHCCDVVAKKINNRLTYPTFKGNPRTDESYSLRTHPDHHQPEFLNKPTILESSGFGMVTQVPVEDLHLIHLGVIRKFMKQIVTGDCNFVVSQNHYNEMNEKILSLYPCIPRAEFARKPRSLKYVHKWKATEGRLFCLYIGMIVLKDSVPNGVYEHFLHLACACRLISTVNARANADVADTLLERYVRNFPAIYGEDRSSSNVHNLLHICEYVRRYGNVNVFSAYRNENYNQQLQSFVRKPSGILQQISNRIEEVFRLNNRVAESGFIGKTERPQPLFPNCPSYKGYKFDEFVLGAAPADAYCQIRPNIQLQVEQFTLLEGEKVVIGRRFQQVDSFFHSPMDSREVGIFLCGQLSTEKEVFRLERIECKFVHMPYKDKIVLAALLHHIK